MIVETEEFGAAELRLGARFSISLRWSELLLSSCPTNISLLTERFTKPGGATS
jgi:hypothetical protein